jgi:uncharacterized membrane protein YozB (DUF420 family)
MNQKTWKYKYPKKLRVALLTVIFVMNASVESMVFLPATIRAFIYTGLSWVTIVGIGLSTFFMLSICLFLQWIDDQWHDRFMKWSYEERRESKKEKVK